MILRICILSVILFFVAAFAYAAPVAVSSENGKEVTLYDDECALKHMVQLPYRATWKEKGKTYEGCFTILPGAGIVVFFFDDKSIALFPTNAFKRMRSM